MGLDRIDAVAMVGVGGLLSTATALETAVVAAALGGFLFSVAAWRLYGGRPWEAAGWLCWVGAAVSAGLGADTPAVLVAVVGFVVLGIVLLLGGRTGVLVDVWSIEQEPNR
ncbi:hypothetical protein [Halopiger goleimassiliensis]|uniref:hypothetical protein n=1 Tax=Halopiger goleimassiliensis TaxID=1293048 RepID=UPI000A5A4E96|nr:hypothetical protein [Halopiger goleimassiliensis]